MPGGRVVTLVSDDRLFSNRVVRNRRPAHSSRPRGAALPARVDRRVSSRIRCVRIAGRATLSGPLFAVGLDPGSLAVGVIALLAASGGWAGAVGYRAPPPLSARARARAGHRARRRARARRGRAAHRGGAEEAVESRGEGGPGEIAEWLASLSGSVRTPEGPRRSRGWPALRGRPWPPKTFWSGQRCGDSREAEAVMTHDPNALTPDGSGLSRGRGRASSGRSTRCSRSGACGARVGSLLARGHVLLEGVPGTAKTLLVRSLSMALGLNYSRIQFTPDLMPSDITGVASREPGVFTFRAGRLR